VTLAVVAIVGPTASSDADYRIESLQYPTVASTMCAPILGGEHVQGTGRFNLTLGAISTAVGIGASLSQVMAGSLVHHWGSRVGFLFLAGVATVALAVLYFFMPETREQPKAGA
jgi:MFS family permease